MNKGWFVLGGFLLGTLGMKAVTSRPAKKAAVRATVCGLQMKDYVDYVVDEAKAQCDDIMAEAQALKADEEAMKAQECTVIEEVEVVSVDSEEKKPARKTGRARSTSSTAKKTRSGRTTKQ